MLISRVEEMPAASDHEYRTASEIFDLMARSQPVEDGTKLASNMEELKPTRKPNRRVETVVYEDDSESDDEIYSSEDIHDLVMMNEEIIDVFKNQSSFSNTLCQKLGDLEIQASNLSLQYDDQLKTSNNFGLCCGFPPSLLDYICCTRPEDNNFYMDNVIRYVKHTIEQLKRISNGDYLTDRVREKWREVDDIASQDNTKILATSSIPLQVGKVNGLLPTSDDVHSEIDVRSLSKILKKKIVVDIPKGISGTFKLFNKLCLDKLVVSCNVTAPEESRVDVVLKIGSETGHVISTINSVMVLKNTPAVLSVECPKMLPLQFNQNEESNEEKVKIVEVPGINDDCNEYMIEEYSVAAEEMDSDGDSNDATTNAPNDAMTIDANYAEESKRNSFVESEDSSVASKGILDSRAIPDLQKGAPYNFIPPDNLSLSMHTFNMDCVPEEVSVDPYPLNKKKSQPKVRIKSPYESKSYAIEEKKRRKLLEIREKREKRKLKIGENCKIAKYRHVRGANAPQPSSSVTKLSISNKSFYNSIYGNVNLDRSLIKGKGHRSKRDLTIETIPFEREQDFETPQTPETEIKKYINRSYNLEETETTMTLFHTETNGSESGCVGDSCAPTLSATSNEFSTKMNIISQIVNIPESGITTGNSSYDNIIGFGEKEQIDGFSGNEEDHIRIKITTSSRSSLNVPVPTNSPKTQDDKHSKKVKSLECRQSIDKLYDLMKKIPMGQKFASNKINTDSQGRHDNNSVQDSESGTSLKHSLPSSNHSNFGFGKIYNSENIVIKNIANKNLDAPAAVRPKVIMNTKQAIVKKYDENVKKDCKKMVVTPPKLDNPLKAISQLLHKFEIIQKTRPSTHTDPKYMKKPDVALVSVPGQGTPKRRSRSDQPGREREMRENEIETKNSKVFPLKERPTRPKLKIIEPSKMPQVPIKDKQTDRAAKKMMDLIDEAKEAKGEAVRGPSKISRLDSLAQPKRSYVQARSEEYQNRYGRRLVAERPRSLLAPQPVTRTRPRPLPRPPMQPSEREPRLRPHGREGRAPTEPSSKQSHADPPCPLKNKMVTVESYVKSHYGRSSSTLGPQARIPLVPTDINSSFMPSSPSGEESSEIGDKLHHLINSIIIPPQPLSALLEAQETNSLASREKEFLPDFKDPGSSVDCELKDIYEDNVKTAVESVEPVVGVDSKSLVKCQSSWEILKLEEQMHGCISMTSLKKCVRSEKLTLTPKHSMQKMLESNDPTLFSTVSKCLKKHCFLEDTAIRSLVNLSDSLDWNYPIPLQVANLAYAFPEYNSAFTRTNSANKSLEDIFNLGTAPNSSSRKDDKKSLKNSVAIPKSRSPPAQAVIVAFDKNSEIPPKKGNELMTSTIGTDACIDFNNSAEHGNCPNIINVKEFTTPYAENMSDNHQDIECGSSLDMLVGILNEIQKITACHMTSADIYANQHECNVLETLLCDDALNKTEKCKDSFKLVTISSLDKLRQLEPSPSIYSLYLSDDRDTIPNVHIPRINTSTKSVLCNNRPYSVDKEVNAEIPVKDLTSTLTGVPSAFFSMATRSTNVSNSLLGILSKPSSQTIISTDYDSLDPILDCKKIIEITEEHSKMPLIKFESGVDKLLRKYERVQNKTKNMGKVSTEIISFGNRTHCMKEDQMIRMKRDILVTVYSMLVLTVFAAITFPEMLYHV